MRIINFNRRIKTEGTWLNTYIDWNKIYCQDLHNKITSLYDYIQWNYPEFLVLNSPTPLSDKSNFNSLLSLSNPIIEPRLIVIYEQEVEMIIDDEGHRETKSIFFPSRLNYHQGFYNTSQYGDGMLCSTETSFQHTLDDREEEAYYISLTKHPLYSNCRVIRWTENGEISTLPTESCTKTEWENMYLCQYDLFGSIIKIIEDKDEYLDVIINDEFNTVSFSLKQWSVGLAQGYLIVFVNPDRKYENGYYSFGYNSENKKWYKILFPSQPYYIDTTGMSLSIYQWQLNEQTDIKQWVQVNPQQLYFGNDENSSYFVCNLNQGKLCAIESISTSPEYNFPSGYLCMLHKLPVGENIDTNIHKLTLDNYFIAPIGNGGYFDIEWNNQNLEASYYANQLDSFTNQISVNLALNCRYINPDLEQFKLQKTSINISNWLITKSKQEPQLTDKYNNIWTGQQSLISRPHFNGEFVFLDIEYNIYSTAESNKKVYYFNATTKQPISLQPQLWFY